MIRKNEEQIRAEIQEIRASRTYSKNYKEGYEDALLWVLGELK